MNTPTIRACWSLRQDEDGFYIECSACRRRIRVERSTNWLEMTAPYPVCECSAVMSK